MQSAQLQLFGTTFAPEDVIDCRVRRVQMRGIASAVVGSLPTWLTIGLRDGRRFEARSRGPGPEQDAIRAVLEPITAIQASAARAAIAGGPPHAFGDVTLSAQGIAIRGALTPWDQIAGWAVRYGGLVYDDERGRLRGEVMLGNIPFGDGLVAAMQERLPDRNYETMAPGAGPSHGFFSITARTRVPGTFKYQLHVFLLGPLILAASFGLYYVVHRIRLQAEYAERARMPKPYETGIDKAAAELAKRDAGASCTKDMMGYEPKLASADRSSAFAYSSFAWKRVDVTDLGYRTQFYVWSVSGPDVRLVLWDESTSSVRCFASAPATSAASPEVVAQNLVLGWKPPPPPAPAPAPPATSAPAPEKPAKKTKRKGR